MHMLQYYFSGVFLSLIRLTVWLILLGLIFIPLERLFFVRRARVFRRAIGADLVYFFVNALLPAAVLAVPLAAVAWAARGIMPVLVSDTVTHWPLAVRIGVALIVAEVGFYWGHRWSHQIPLLWRFHVVHHSPTHVDWLVNSRGHPVDFIFTRFCGLMPLYALGLGSPISGQAGTTALMVMLLGPVWGFFIHANLRWRFGPLEWLIALPAFHHWHHTNDDPAMIDKNFAPMFPLVDRIFGTLYLPHDQQPAVYGTGTVVSPGLVGQLLDPFSEPRPFSQPWRYSSIDSTASAADSEGMPEDGRSRVKASANP